MSNVIIKDIKNKAKENIIKWTVDDHKRETDNEAKISVKQLG